MRVGSSIAFAVAGSSSGLTWAVNGIKSGSAAAGVISSTGIYTPGAGLAGSSVQITAVFGTQTAAALSVAVLNPLPTLSSGSVTQAAVGAPFLVDVHGSGFLPTSKLQVGGVAGAVAYVSSTELQSTIALSSSPSTVNVSVYNDNAAQAAPTAITLSVKTAPFASLTQATRLLDQTSFGPTLSTIQHVKKVGITAYLNEQVAAPSTHMLAIPAPTPPIPTCPDATYRCAQSSFWQNALTANDQLRQRVAFALSEIFVVSTNSVNARTIPAYQNLLADAAFGNFRTLMEGIATSPAMGSYLNMLDSGAPSNGEIANENFAREFLQLFTTGTYLLHPDGTLNLDSSGKPQPVYTQTQLQAYARAYTGWTFANGLGGLPTRFPNGLPNFDQPMMPFAAAHDTSQKVLLSGVTLPAGQTAQQDLEAALDSIFQHPNVGPFIGRQLIQHLVTSNPSPAYVGRVAAVFNNNGSGVRGDMKAVVLAILNDAEARANDTAITVDGGHLREPVLYVTAILRALGSTNTDPQGRYDYLSSYTADLGQTPYAAPSVFNFFPPNYVIPGTQVNAPEFAQENTAEAIIRMTLADTIVRNHLRSMSTDMSAQSILGKTASQTGNAAADSANLVESLNILFLHDQMPDAMRTSITNQVEQIADIGQRVRFATWLVISSNFYKVER